MQIVFVIKKNMWYKKAKLIEWCKEHYAVLKHHIFIRHRNYGADDHRSDRVYG